MTHDWAIFAVGTIFTVVGWLLVRFVGRVDRLEERIQTLFPRQGCPEDHKRIDGDVESEEQGPR